MIDLTDKQLIEELRAADCVLKLANTERPRGYSNSLAERRVTIEPGDRKIDVAFGWHMMLVTIRDPQVRCALSLLMETDRGVALRTREAVAAEMRMPLRTVNRRIKAGLSHIRERLAAAEGAMPVCDGS